MSKKQKETVYCENPICEWEAIETRTRQRRDGCGEVEINLCGQCVTAWDMALENQDKIDRVINAAHEIVDDFDAYGEVLQTDDQNEYGETSAIERLRAALKEVG